MVWLGVAAILVVGAAIFFIRGRDGMPRFALPSTVAIPDPDLSAMEPRVRQRIHEARTAVVGRTSSADAWGWLGEVSDVHNLYDCAAICYRRAMSLNSNDFRWPYMLARVLGRSGSGTDQAVTLMRAALELKPDYAPAYVRLGDLLAGAGQWSQASVAYQQAIALDGGIALAHRGLGQAWLHLNNPQAAAQHLERATKLTPADAAAFTALAQAYTRLGDRSRAAEAMEEARGKKPVHALTDPVWLEVATAGISSSICAERGERYLKHGQFQLAIREYTIVEEVMPDNPYVQHGLGVAYMNTDQAALAIVHFSKAVQLDQGFSSARIKLGSLLTGQGRLEEAVVQLRRAVADAPDSAAAHQELATVLAKSGRLDDALAEFKRAAALADLDANGYSNWGSALAQSGDLNQAMASFLKALELQPENPTIHFNIGYLLESAGRVHDAMEYYAQAVQLDPGHRAAERLATLESSVKKP